MTARLLKARSAYRDRRQDIVVLTLLTPHKSLQNPGNPLHIYLSGGFKLNNTHSGLIDFT